MNVIATAADKMKSGWCQKAYRMDLPEGEVFCGVGALTDAFRQENPLCTLTEAEKSEEIKVIAEVVIENYRDELVDYAEALYKRVNPESHIARFWAEEAIDENNASMVVITFNDNIAKSADEVVAVFEKAAARWDERIS